MSLLNIAMQGVALAREKMDPIFEAALKGCGTMEKIREACEGNQALTQAVLDSLPPLLNFLMKGKKNGQGFKRGKKYES